MSVCIYVYTKIIKYVLINKCMLHLLLIFLKLRIYFLLSFIIEFQLESVLAG